MEKEMYEAVIELQYKAINNLMEANKKLMDFISQDETAYGSLTQTKGSDEDECNE